MQSTIAPERRLWTNHGAVTPEQLGLFAEGDRKASQADRLLAELRQARANHAALPLPDIMRLGIAQHGARLRELRLRGYKIENHMERTAEGEVRSEYRLTFDPETDDLTVQP
jgi:hypothetical protein